MPSESWRETTLADFVSLQRGHDLPDPQRRPGRVPILGSFGITGYHDTAKAKGPGVTVGRSGASFGVVSFSPGDYWPLNTALYVTDFNGNDERFAYYFLKTLDFTRYNSGSAQPSLNRNYIASIRIRIPPPAEQRTIAAVLGSLDDKIECNRRMNRTLEAMTRAIFQSWFVDFDPVRAKIDGRAPAGMDAVTASLFPEHFEDSELGIIPMGWKIAPLDQTADFLNGLALQKYPPVPERGTLPVIKIAQLRAGNVQGADLASDAVPSPYIVEDGDLLFSWSGSLMVDFWSGGRGALNQHLFKVTSSRFPLWFTHRWILEYLPTFQGIAADKATTMGHIQRRHLKEAKVVFPPEPVLRAADNIIGSLQAKQLQNNLESRTLEALRDTLLPKLISGELRVPEAEQVVERAWP